MAGLSGHITRPDYLAYPRPYQEFKGRTTDPARIQAYPFKIPLEYCSHVNLIVRLNFNRISTSILPYVQSIWCHKKQELCTNPSTICENIAPCSSSPIARCSELVLDFNNGNQLPVSIIDCDVAGCKHQTREDLFPSGECMILIRRAGPRAFLAEVPTVRCLHPVTFHRLYSTTAGSPVRNRSAVPLARPSR